MSKSKYPYKLKNRTKIDTDLIHDIIAFCCPKGLKNFTIEINPLKYPYWHGRAHENRRKRVVIGINEDIKNQYNHDKTEKAQGYIKRRLLKDYIETLVYALSHEFFHLFEVYVQKRNSSKDTWNAYPPEQDRDYVSFESERNCTKYGTKMLDKYRKICKTL